MPVFRILYDFMVLALGVFVLYVFCLLLAYAGGKIIIQRLNTVRTYIWILSLLFALFSLMIYTLRI